MNPQNSWNYGEWPLTQNVYAGDKIPGSYEQNLPYGRDLPYGENVHGSQNPPYGVNQPYESNVPHVQKMPYGVNQPYESNVPHVQKMPYGMNQPYEPNTPYGQNPSYESNAPYSQKPPYGMNQPYEPNTPYSQNPSYGSNARYSQNPPYGMNQPYGPNVPYNQNPSYESNAPYSQNPPYGMNQPYAPNAPYGQNPSYESNAPYSQNPPYRMNQPYGPNVPYNQNPSYESNAPYSLNPPYGMNQSHGPNVPCDQNPPYGVNQSYGPNVPYDQNPPYGMNHSYAPNAPYDQNPPYGMNHSYAPNVPYDQNPPNGINPSYSINQAALYGQYPSSQAGLPYGINLPCEMKMSYGRAKVSNPPAVSQQEWQQGTIAPYQNQYQIAPNKIRHAEKPLKKETRQLLLFGIAGIMTAAFLAIMIGLSIHNDGTGMNMAEAFSFWKERLTSGNEDDDPMLADSFPTRSSGTVRGEMFAVGEDGSIFVRTEYGVCRIGKSGNGYEYNGWAAELDPDITVRSMAVYGDYLYLACGEKGIYRVNTARSNTVTQIIDDDVTSFLIAEDHLFYLSMEYPEPTTVDLSNTEGYFGELYVAGLNGNGSQSLGEKVRCVSKHLSSADFIYVDGYLYYFDEELNLKRMHADGTRSRVVVDHERQKSSFIGCGLYENDGVLYLPSAGKDGIYAYDMEADRLKKVSNARLSYRSPILFAGDALLYREEMNCEWHQIKDGKDTIYGSPLNGAELWMQAVGTGELFAFHEQNGYYDVSFWNGEIRSEEPVIIDGDTMPEVDIEEDPDWLLQGTIQADCRAAHLACVGSEESSAYEHYVIFQRYQYDTRTGVVGSTGLVWNYVDEDGEHTELLVEGKIQTFIVEHDILYYTKWDEASESAVLFRAALVPEGTASELLIEGISEKFVLCGGMIYYVDQNDGSLYRYDTTHGETERIGYDKVGCYDIWNGTIYYENIGNGTVYKMRLDGTDVERIALTMRLDEKE